MKSFQSNIFYNPQFNLLGYYPSSNQFIKRKKNSAGAGGKGEVDTTHDFILISEDPQKHANIKFYFIWEFHSIIPPIAGNSGSTTLR